MTAKLDPRVTALPLSEQVTKRCQAEESFRDMDGGWASGICGDTDVVAVISVTFRSAAYAEYCERPQHVLEGICAAHLSELMHADHACDDECMWVIAQDEAQPWECQIDWRVEAVL